MHAFSHADLQHEVVAIAGLAFSGNGRLLAAATASGHVMLLCVVTRKLLCCVAVRSSTRVPVQLNAVQIRSDSAACAKVADSSPATTFLLPSSHAHDTLIVSTAGAVTARRLTGGAHLDVICALPHSSKQGGPAAAVVRATQPLIAVARPSGEVALLSCDADGCLTPAGTLVPPDGCAADVLALALHPEGCAMVIATGQESLQLLAWEAL